MRRSYTSTIPTYLHGMDKNNFIYVILHPAEKKKKLM